jgi:hypothetical protein
MIRVPASLFACAALAAQAPLVIRPPLPALAPVTTVSPAAPAAGAAAAEARAIDLAICLDISGSMDGLIDAARQNLWAVVNDLATLQPTPQLRVALLSYGCSAHDRERGWVKVETDFTTDLDLVSQRLFALTTNGGDEYVARVVRAALTELQWTKTPGTLALLFVAGNEAATQDPAVDAAAQSRAAIARGIVVNTIYCGSPTDQIAPGWRDVAKLADGQFAAIEKDDAVVIATPFDEQLAALSASINTTYVPYGAQRETWAANQVAQDGNAAALNVAAAAQRCQTKAGALYSNDHWDLVDACDRPGFALAEVKKEELPEALRALSVAELRAHVAAKKGERTKLRAQVDELGKQRDAFVLAEKQKLGARAGTMFETAVLEAVRQQAAARGFHRPPPVPGAAAAPAGQDVASPFTTLLRGIAANYERFTLVTGEPRHAPTLCRAPLRTEDMAPPVRRSAAAAEHGDKLYLLYARFADGVQYVKAGEPAKVGQTLVKQAWQCMEGEPTGAEESARRHVATPVLREHGKVFHAGASRGLYVMHKLAADTADTDQGWVYGTIDRDGVVTSAGRVASCMKCHQDAPEDRRFGLR